MQRCPHLSFQCPSCGHNLSSYRFLIDHWLDCSRISTDKSRAELQGVFVLVGRDVLRKIVNFLKRDDVVSFAQCNSYIYNEVKIAWR